MIIRQIKVSDAENFLSLTQQVEGSSEYMLFEPGERNLTPELQRQKIDSIEKEENSTIFVVEKDFKMIGYLVAIGGHAKRNKHSVYIVIGILKDYRGLGIGTRLFQELEKWASERSLHRFELTVVTRNKAGLALYKKIGFEIEGTKRHSLFIGGKYVDEYYMSKIL